MASAHAHDHHHGHPHGAGDRALRIALAITLLVFAAELVGAIASGSLALLADAGHLLSDVAALALARGGGGLNVRAALRHVLADALSAAGVIVSALVVLATGWRRADPVAGLAIAVLVMWSGVTIVRESVDVLMEAAPEGIDIDVLGNSLAAVDGVVEVHDLHVWTVTSGFPAVAAHVTVEPAAEPSIVRRRMAELLRNHFGIEHSTLQVERAGEELRLIQIMPRDVRGG